MRRVWGFRAAVMAGLCLVAIAVMGIGSSDSDARTVYSNYCEAHVYSNLPHGLPLTSHEKYGHDSWLANREPKWLPRWSGPDVPRSSSYGTVSGFARGCWNHLKWGDEYGTVEIYLSDPYSGANLYHCRTTGYYLCYHQEHVSVPYEPGYAADRLGGGELLVNYKICMAGIPCPGTHTAAAEYPVPKANP